MDLYGLWIHMGKSIYKWMMTGGSPSLGHFHMFHSGHGHLIVIYINLYNVSMPSIYRLCMRYISSQCELTKECVILLYYVVLAPSYIYSYQKRRIK